MNKAIIFDFDGTLTYKTPNIWKAIWSGLGYSTNSESYYAFLYRAFVSGKISHQQWCDLTCEAFNKKGLNNEMLSNFASKTNLLNGAEIVFKFLKQRGYSLHIVSGNIKEVIVSVLGENVKYFDSINANRMLFDNDGNLTRIVGTFFDFEGKAMFIEEYIKHFGVKKDDICFVGNGDNDMWAFKTGCNSVCINPEKINKNDLPQTTKYFEKISNLGEILPELCFRQRKVEKSISTEL